MTFGALGEAMSTGTDRPSMVTIGVIGTPLQRSDVVVVLEAS